MPNYFQRLEKTLQERDISKGALAKHLQVALSTISRWKRAMPRAETVQKTADFLGVSAQWLMTGETENALQSPFLDDLVKAGISESAAKFITGQISSLSVDQQLTFLEQFFVSDPAVSLRLEHLRWDRTERTNEAFLNGVRELVDMVTKAVPQIADKELAMELFRAGLLVSHYEPEFRKYHAAMIDHARTVLAADESSPSECSALRQAGPVLTPSSTPATPFPAPC